ncbi:MAG: hypothetical protein JNL10_15715 [Verrucomicrobiales bacterium]|nr:hypothetical protein [Verrucomicrobiales bacterium]
MNSSQSHPPDGDSPDALERRIASQPFRPLPSDWKHVLLPPVTSPASGLSALREFLTPSRWVWGTLAALWVLVAGFGFAAERTARSGISLVHPDAPRGSDRMEEWRQRQELISLLLDDRMPGDRQPAAPPRPRSDLRAVRHGRRSLLRISRRRLPRISHES